MPARFSPLMLDFGERYIRDVGVLLAPSAEQADALGLRTTRARKGRLKLATWSLTFVPDDSDAPILRLLLKSCAAPTASDAPDGFEISCPTALHKFESLQPFRSARLHSALAFTLQHIARDEFMHVACALHEACRMPSAEAAARHASLGAADGPGSFDLTELVDPLEVRRGTRRDDPGNSPRWRKPCLLTGPGARARAARAPRDADALDPSDPPHHAQVGVDRAGSS